VLPVIEVADESVLSSFC